MTYPIGNITNFLGNKTNTMGAFFSGTDDANENMNQFYAVWGKVTDNEPQFAFRWVCGDKKVVCEPDLLIDWPSLTYTEETKTFTKKRLAVLDADDVVDIETKVPEEKEHEGVSYIERTELIKGPFKEVPYPEDWNAQHSVKSYAQTHGGFYGRSGYKAPATSKDAKQRTYEQTYIRNTGYDYYPSEEDYSSYDYYFDDYGYGYGADNGGTYYRYKQQELLEQREEDESFDDLTPKQVSRIQNQKISSSSKTKDALTPKIISRKKGRGGR